MTSDLPPAECSPPDPNGAAIVSRLVGVPDGRPQELWKLWTGVGGDNCPARLEVLRTTREHPRGEQAIAHLVTYGVLRALGELAATARGQDIVEVFASASLSDLTQWADDPALLAALLSKRRTG